MMSSIMFAVQQEICNSLNFELIAPAEQEGVNKFSLECFCGVAVSAGAQAVATAEV